MRERGKCPSLARRVGVVDSLSAVQSYLIEHADSAEAGCSETAKLTPTSAEPLRMVALKIEAETLEMQLETGA